jgi:hypothetical protein
MPDDGDCQSRHALNYAPPRRAEYPWWHDVLWGLAVAVGLMLFAGWFFSGNSS